MHSFWVKLFFRGLLNQKLLKEREAEKRRSEKAKLKPAVDSRGPSTSSGLKPSLKSSTGSREASTSSGSGKGVRFSNVDQVSILPEKDSPSSSSASSLSKTCFKLPSSSSLGSFKIPRKRKLEDGNGSSSRDESPKGSSSSDTSLKLAKVSKNDQNGHTTPENAPESSAQQASAGCSSSAAASSSEEIRKLRLAHFEKLGFVEPVKPESPRTASPKPSPSSSGEAESIDRKPGIGQTSSSDRKQSQAQSSRSSHSKPDSGPGDSRPPRKLDQNKMDAKLGLTSHPDRKRKELEGVKVIFNGREIKVPKLTEIKSEKDPTVADTNGVKSGKPEPATGTRFGGSDRAKPVSVSSAAAAKPSYAGSESSAALKPELKAATPETKRDIKAENGQTKLASAQSLPAGAARFKCDQPSSVAEAKIVPKSEAAVKPSLDPEIQDFVANVIKECLKPFYARSIVSKETYKVIMKKSMGKVMTHAMSTSALITITSLPSLVNKDKVKKLVEAYVEKYK